MGYLKTIYFPLETNGKLMFLGLPVLIKHCRVMVFSSFQLLENLHMKHITLPMAMQQDYLPMQFHLLLPCKEKNSTRIAMVLLAVGILEIIYAE